MLCCNFGHFFANCLMPERRAPVPKNHSSDVFLADFWAVDVEGESKRVFAEKLNHEKHIY